MAGIARSSYYYKPTGRAKGKQPSTHTSHRLGHRVVNGQLVDVIKDMLDEEFIDYGYKRTTEELKRMGWIINGKKVYRLMKAHQLLYPARKRARADKSYVQHTKPQPQYPFHIIEVDIKYIWLHWQRRHAYLVTLLCVKTRFAIGWELALTMKNAQIAALLAQALSHPIVLSVASSGEHTFRIRTDNGPQFIAKKLAEEISEMHLAHEFIHPGTPQQNGHIEGFHSTVERLICQSYELKYLSDATEVFTRFYRTYNYKRIMAGIGYITPFEAIQQWAVTNEVELPSLTCLENEINPT